MVRDTAMYDSTFKYGDNQYSSRKMRRESNNEITPDFEYVQVHVLRRILCGSDFLLQHEISIFLEKLSVAGRNALCGGNGLIKYRDFVISIEKLPRFSVNSYETRWPDENHFEVVIKQRCWCFHCIYFSFDECPFHFMFTTVNSIHFFIFAMNFI